MLNAKEIIMVNTQLFKTREGAAQTAVNTLNHQNAGAYAFGPRHQLAQMAVTGALGQTFYASAEEQLDQIANREKKLPKAFITQDGFHITAAARRYLAPLIRGEAPPPYGKNGLPQYIELENVAVRKQLPTFAT